MAYPKKKKTKWEKCADCGLKCSATFPGKDGKKRCVQCNVRRKKKC
jgi:hypothetical protein